MEDSCICLDTFWSQYLGLHEVSNTILHDIVHAIQEEYIPDMPPTLPTHPGLADEKYIQLGGQPWSSEYLMTRETLEMAIIACLTREGYKLSMDITMDATSRVFFFIRDHDSSSTEVLIPDMAKLSVGDYNRPTVVRSKSSFFRNYNGRTRKRTKGSLRKRTISREVRAPSVMTHKPRLSELAWWQQASTDMSSDQDDDDRL